MNFKKYTTWGLAINLLLITSTSVAQTYKSSSWSTNFYLGGSNLLGDLGGSRFIGNRGVFDYNIRANRMALGTGLTMNTGAFSVGLNVLGTRLVSNDAYSRQNLVTKERKLKYLSRQKKEVLLENQRLGKNSTSKVNQVPGINYCFEAISKAPCRKAWCHASKFQCGKFLLLARWCQKIPPQVIPWKGPAPKRVPHS